MSKLNWKEWLGVGAVAVLVAILAFAGLLEFQHLKQDEANLHAVIRLLNFNLAKGKIDVEPGVEAVVPPAPTVAKPPAVPDKK